MAENRGSDDLDSSKSAGCFNVVGQLYQQGRYQEAIALATQARDLARQHLGQNHPRLRRQPEQPGGVVPSDG